MVYLFLAGCAIERDDDPFFNNDGRYDPPDWSASDTADGGDTADSGSGGDAGAPVLTDEALSWDDMPNVGTVLLFQAAYTDEGDDIVGGTCYIDAFNDDEFVQDFVLDVTDSPDGEGVCVAIDGTFFFALQDLDDSKSGAVTVEVKDGSGNVSATYEAQTGPAE